MGFYTRIVGSILSRSMDVSLRLFCARAVLCRYRPCDKADHPSKET
jgi:hypothetical protein